MEKRIDPTQFQAFVESYYAEMDHQLCRVGKLFLETFFPGYADQHVDIAEENDDTTALERIQERFVKC